jgi:serine protease Do
VAKKDSDAIVRRRGLEAGETEMKDLRLVWVLIVSLGIIVLGGVMVPVLLNAISSEAGTIKGPAAVAVETPKAEDLPPIPPDVDRLSQAFREAAKRVMPAVVSISTSQTVTAPASPFGDLPDDLLKRYFGESAPGKGGAPQKFQRHGLGSGVIVDKEGHILTNNHVVEGAEDITVHLSDGRDFKAKVIGRDPPTDVAVIQIKADKLPIAQLGDSDAMQVGDWVLAVGAPFGLDKTVTAGIISATGRHNVGISDYESFLQTDAAINPGNSGGPLVDMRGQVVGINTAIASRTGGYMGVGFAVPVNLAKEVMKRILETGHVVRGWLGVGIQSLTPEMAETMKLKSNEGALVSQVFEDGPAGKAGLKPGDVIVELGGKPIKGASDLQGLVAWIAPGTKVDVVYRRDGARKTAKVTVEQRSEEALEAAAETPGALTNLKDLGLEVSNVTAEATQRYGYKPGQGVLITVVDASGLGSMVGLRPGMLILKVGELKVGTVAELKEAMTKVDLVKGVPLLVRSGNSQMFVLMKKR